ncbi:hypothetical protein COJ96_06080 [Bacillus sp. AFS073361]|uniref:hypothetical protein n=1 Tax=Bacillus sp. AFS073361 TaxID=2033511 RepID=UPI000BF52A0B|nr:hypothetical protein [Bacillus sp. AFS073361]PFP30278.1 hypothetical protein COJ96_06080 [Bacillus sp. AFS073361]
MSWSKMETSQYNPVNKQTLDKLSDNGTSLFFNGASVGGSTQVSVTGRPYALFSLRGGVINIQSDTFNNKILYYSIPKLDTDRYRRLFWWTASGGYASIDIPDGTLNDNDALVYNISTNTLTTKNGTWGNVSVSQNEYLLLYNNLGNIGGLLSKYVNFGSSTRVPIRELGVADYYTSNGSPQGLFLMDEYYFACAGPVTDDYTTYANMVMYNKSTNALVKSISQNFGHMNTVDYSTSKNSLLISNGSKSYTMPPIAWILPNFKEWATNSNNTVLEYNTVDKITLDFSQLSSEFKGQFVWGYDNTDIIYMISNECRTLRKILLGKGTNNLGSGVYVNTTDPNRYNGSYQILNTWQSNVVDVHSDMFFYKGNVYMGIKGANQIRKAIPMSDGTFESEYLPLITNTNGTLADVEGLDYDNEYLYIFNAYDGYRLSINNLY